MIALHLKPALGDRRLQGLRPVDVESFLASKTALAPAALEKIFTVLSSALKAAGRNQLVARNVATLVSNAPASNPDRMPALVSPLSIRFDSHQPTPAISNPGANQNKYVSATLTEL